MYTTSFVIHPLQRKDLQAAAKICTSAMVDNPIHIQVFGRSPELRERRLTRFFLGLLPYVHRKGEMFGAYADGTLAGVLGALPPNSCKPSVGDILKLLPTLLTSTSPVGIWRLAIWLGTWARIDPREPHWHLGPLAVNPLCQRQGVGTQLIEYAFGKISGASLYLETDKLVNVQLYERFGFTVTATPVILKTPSWVMKRKV